MSVSQTVKQINQLATFVAGLTAVKKAIYAVLNARKSKELIISVMHKAVIEEVLAQLSGNLEIYKKYLVGTPVQTALYDAFFEVQFLTQNPTTEAPDDEARLRSALAIIKQEYAEQKQALLQAVRSL